MYKYWNIYLIFSMKILIHFLKKQACPKFLTCCFRVYFSKKRNLTVENKRVCFIAFSHLYFFLVFIISKQHNFFWEYIQILQHFNKTNLNTAKRINTWYKNKKPKKYFEILKYENRTHMEDLLQSDMEI